MENILRFIKSKKGEILAAFLLFLFLLFYCSHFNIVKAEETTAGVMYERVTDDGIVEDRQVRQITTKIITYEFTLNEIDSYIEMQKKQLESLQDSIKKLEAMRKAVFDEANK